VVHEDGWRIDGCPHAGPSLAYDGEGRLHVGWYTGAEGAPGIYHAVSEDGGATFGEPHGMLTGEWVPVSLVSLATDAGGRVWAGWDDRRTEPVTVSVARLGANGATDVIGTVRGKAPSLAAGASGGVATALDGGAIRILRWQGTQ
jgi:hypothetical protein